MENNNRLAKMIASEQSYVPPDFTSNMIEMLTYLSDEVLLEVARCSQSVLAGRLEPMNCLTMEGFMETHRKLIGLFLESMD